MTSAKDHEAKVSRGSRQADVAAESARPATFEEGLASLADLVGRLEGGQLGLAESIAAYESGVRIVRSLHAELADVEQRVRLLTAPAAPEEDGAGAPDGPNRSGGRKGASRKTSGGPAAGGTGASGSRARNLPGMDDPESDV